MTDDLQIILNCTIENLYFMIPLLLLTGMTAFFAGKMVTGRTKKRSVCLLPLIAAELFLIVIVFPYLNRWAGFRSITWGFTYEGGWDFYLPFTAMVGILIGYLMGTFFARRKE